MKILKHCSQTFPTTATGSIVGMDQNGILEVTNSFPFPTPDAATAEAHQDTIHNLAASAPRQKSNAAYQNEMIKYLREVNVDANNVGWYMSTDMGHFVNQHMIENQYFYQRDMNERTVALVYDVSRSVQGSLSLKAFRLSPIFMAAYKEGKFTSERYVDLRLSLKQWQNADRHHVVCKRMAFAIKTSSLNYPSSYTTRTSSRRTYTSSPALPQPIRSPFLPRCLP